MNSAAMHARPLDEIAAGALLATCGWCWSAPGQPCDCARPGGMHVARLGRAYRRGLVSGADLMAVPDALVVFTSASVVYGEKGRVAA